MNIFFFFSLLSPLFSLFSSFSAGKDPCNYGRGALLIQPWVAKIKASILLRLLDLDTWHTPSQVVPCYFRIPTNQLTLKSQFLHKSLKATIVRPCGIPHWLKIKQITSHAKNYYTIPSSTTPMISLSYNRGDKMASDGFQEANQYLENKNICLTLKADEVIAPFA